MNVKGRSQGGARSGREDGLPEACTGREGRRRVVRGSMGGLAVAASRVGGPALSPPEPFRPHEGTRHGGGNVTETRNRRRGPLAAAALAALMGAIDPAAAAGPPD